MDRNFASAMKVNDASAGKLAATNGIGGMLSLSCNCDGIPYMRSYLALLTNAPPGSAPTWGKHPARFHLPTPASPLLATNGMPPYLLPLIAALYALSSGTRASCRLAKVGLYDKLLWLARTTREVVACLSASSFKPSHAFPIGLHVRNMLYREVPAGVRRV